jgi:hypothetical protein
MRSKEVAMTALTPSKSVPFAAQSRDEPVPYSVPASAIKGVPLHLLDDTWYIPLLALGPDDS